jgi:hypothetical protein
LATTSPLTTPFPTPAARHSAAMGTRLRDLAMLGSIFVFGLLANDWIASAALATLFVGWRYMFREQGPPIVAVAFSNQWLQVTVGILYFAMSGRKVVEMRTDDYRPMVVLGLGCVIALFGGFYLAAGFRRKRSWRELVSRPLPWTTNQIAMVYIVSVAMSGVLQELAWSMGGLTQVILVFSRVRFVFLFLLITRLAKPKLRGTWIIGILAVELALGFAGFFADFREPLVIAAIAFLGAMDRKKAKTWAIVGGLAILAISSALVWTAIKPVIRRSYSGYATRSERLTAVLTVTGSTFAQGSTIWKYESDSMVSRIWAVYFPALALKRVPAIVPYKNGAILRGAIENVLTPRLFFPEKPVLPSQSDEVREYSGVWVGGRETNTSYAFGYAGESYVDFGVPLMFVPVFVFGILLGLAYRWLNKHIVHDELRTGVVIVIFWSTLGVYEASWIMLVGPSITILAVLGGGAYLLDRTLTSAEKQRVRRPVRRGARGWSPDITTK